SAYDIIDKLHERSPKISSLRPLGHFLGNNFAPFFGKEGRHALQESPCKPLTQEIRLSRLLAFGKGELCKPVQSIYQVVIEPVDDGVGGGLFQLLPLLDGKLQHLFSKLLDSFLNISWILHPRESGRELVHELSSQV